VRLVQTSSGDPAQWDGWDQEGRYYYLRYRCGAGEVRQYRTPDWSQTRKDELIRIVAAFEHGHPLDGGVISLDEFAEHAGITIGLGCRPDRVLGPRARRARNAGHDGTAGREEGEPGAQAMRSIARPGTLGKRA
jgi:hypothetical protein